MKQNKRPQFVIFHNEQELLDIKKDIYMLYRHLDLIKDQMNFEEEKVLKTKRETLNEIKDDNFKDIRRGVAEMHVEEMKLWLQNGIPQIVINPFIVSVWSIFESVIKDFACVLQQAKDIEKSIYSAKGAYFIERAQNYFNNSLEYPLPFSEYENEELRLVGDIRNSIVHHYGKVSGLRSNLKTKILQDKIDGINYSEEDGKIILSIDFAERAFEEVRNYLLSLLNEYQQINKTS